MSLDKRYRANDQECAAKVIDGEAVIINLINGTYYGLDKSGGTAWELLALGHTPNEVSAALVSRYEVSETQARTDMTNLMDELLKENLLVFDESVHPGAIATSAHSTREAYDTPVLTAYRDMAELLALDPPMPQLENMAAGDSKSTGKH